MEKQKQVQKKQSATAIFFEELSKSSGLVTFLAILTGILISGLLVAFTTVEVYQAFSVSFWGGIKEIVKTAWSTYSTLFMGAFGNPKDIVAAFQGGDALTIRRAINPFFESLVQATPYIFAGLSVALGFRVGLFNIGAEGQIFIGALTATYAGYAITGLPAFIHIPLAMLAGALGGAIWGFVPGFLKAKTGAHEVIITIMMNYIAFKFTDFMINGPMQDPNEYTPKTPWIQESAQLTHLFADPIRFHIGFFIALGVAYLVYWLLFKTTWGFELRTVGSNPNGARYAGINTTKSTVIAMSLAGSLAGMAGANEVLGLNFRLVPSFSSGYGFDSIALALLGKNHPLGVVLSALLFGFLRNGSRQMQLKAGVPIDIVSILQALILAFIAAPAIIRTIYRLKKPDIEEEGVRVSGWGGK
ncbi:MAG: ABC transporter permease [Pelolinea sp.]|jgi:simple sugar transport system permease protein|nr:ABC transporter permease [Pelolinea sp.]